MIAQFQPGRPARRPFAALAAFVAAGALASCTLTDRQAKPASAGPGTAPAASARPEAADEFGRVTRVHDLRDLLVEVPDFEAPAFGLPHAVATPPASRPTTEPARTREQLAADLIRLVKDTVAPESWDERGGPVAREVKGELIATATPAVHAQLEALFTQLRQSRSVTITVEARFVTLGDEELAKLTGRTADLVNGDVAPPAPGKPSSGAVAFLDAEMFRDVLRATQAAREATVVTAPRVTLFNGQRAYVTVATSRAYVKSLNISKAADGKTSYEPEMDVVNSGVLFDVRATATADRKHATLTLRPQLSTLVGLKNVPFPNAPPGENLEVQQPDVETSAIETTVTVPDGQTVLIRGLRGAMTLPGNKDEPSPIRNLLLFVKPTLLVDGKPLITAPPPASRPAVPADQTEGSLQIEVELDEPEASE